MLLLRMAALLIVITHVSAVSLSERESLTNLYNATHGDAWTCGTISSNCSSTSMVAKGYSGESVCSISTYKYGFGPWLTSNVCDWYGVACEDSHIVALCLVKNNINGNLVDLDLPYLRYLVIIAAPLLTGILPSSYARTLPVITHIDFDTTGIWGTLPQGWSAMSSLSQLFLYNTQISGTLPEGWSEMSSLSQLYLSSTQISGTLPEGWSAMSLISELDVAGTYIAGTLPEGWSAISSLSMLDAAGTGISGTLPEGWSAMSSLFHLNVADTYIAGTLPEGWSAMSSLSILGLGRTGISGTLPESWSAMSSLSILNIAGTSISGVLPEGWSAMSSLSQLGLSSTQISGALPEGWSTMPSLSILYLDSTQLSGTLPEGWSTMPSLSRIGLGYTQIAGTLPEGWSAMQSLSMLYLDSTLVSGTLPEGWSAMPSLSILSLSSTQISGTIPEGWSAMSSLSELGLGSTQLSGTLPEGWSTMSSLSILYLSSTQVSGTLPEGWSAMSSLSQLYLSSTQISGTIPEGWSALSSISELELQDNSLSGVIPSSWSRLKNLKVLRLNGNTLTGDFAHVASRMKELRVLTVSCQGDKIRGVIPCNQPFDLSSERVLRLTGSLPHLSVIDVQNETAILDTVPFWKNRASEQPAIESFAILVWGVAVSIFVLLVLSLEAAHRYYGTRFSPFRLMRACDAFAVSPLDQSVFLGSLEWIAVAAVCALVYVQVWSFRFSSQSLFESTRPFEESRLSKNLNFTFNMSVPLQNVSDKWRTNQLTFLAQPPQFSSKGGMYEFPVGWDPFLGQLRREITFSVDLANLGGFSWSLGIAGKDIVYGYFSGARHSGAVTMYLNETIGTVTVGNNTHKMYAEKAQQLNSLSGYLVPNRVTLNKRHCLSSVNISLLATPRNVSVVADAPSGTIGNAFQSYIFSQPTPLLSNLINGSVCGPTSVKLVLEQNTVLLDQSVERTRTSVDLATLLLGLFGGVVSALRITSRAYTAVYKRWKRRKGKEESPLLLVPLIDTDATGDWTAQKEWNRSMSERIRRTETRLDSFFVVHEGSEVKLNELRRMVEKLSNSTDALELSVDK